MRFTILFFLTILLCENFHAQKNPPPREGLAVRIGDSILKEDGFKIDFPSKPIRTVKSVDTAYGKSNMVNYTLSTSLAYYQVNFIDFPTVIAEKTEIDLRFDLYKAGLLKIPDTRLISESEVSFGDSPGAEYVIENKDSTLTSRALLIQQRFVSLTVITKGKVSGASERLKAFNRKTVEQFFNSFSITELPAPQSVAVELPKDFGIKISDLNFTSDFFGFSIQLPENWNVVKKEQTDVIKDLTVQRKQDNTERVRKSFELSLNNTEMLLFLTKSNLETSSNNSVLAIAAEKVSFPNFLPAKVADNYIKTFMEANEQVLKNPSSVKLGGADFAWIEIENTAEKFKQRFYFANRKGIAFEILLIYRSEEDLQAMLDSLQTVKFFEDKMEK